MSGSATSLSAHLVRRGVAAVALVAALLGAPLLLCHATTDSASPLWGGIEPSMQADEGVVDGTAHSHACGHHLPTGIEMKVGRSASSRDLGGTTGLLALGALAAVVLVIRANHGSGSDPGRRRWRGAGSGGLRSGRLLLLDMSVAQT